MRTSYCDGFINSMKIGESNLRWKGEFHGNASTNILPSSTWYCDGFYKMKLISWNGCVTIINDVDYDLTNITEKKLFKRKNKLKSQFPTLIHLIIQMSYVGHVCLLTMQ